MSSGHCRRSLGKPAPALYSFPSNPTDSSTNRTITAAAVVVSAAGYGGIISLSQYVFFKPYVFTTKIFPQLWRPLTAFLITKPKFGILLDPYFCYQYGSGLERESSRFSQPGDFFVYTAFCASIIVVSTLLRS
jgi:Derlin-2/3